MDDDDGLTIDDVIEDDELTRAIRLAEALLAPCDFDCEPASVDRLHTVLQCDGGFVDLVLKLVPHYRPPTGSWQQ